MKEEKNCIKWSNGCSILLLKEEWCVCLCSFLVFFGVFCEIEWKGKEFGIGIEL